MLCARLLSAGCAWLFIDTPAGADASAVHYSLIQTTKLHALEPYPYLNSVFTALPYAETVEDIEALLLWNFKTKPPLLDTLGSLSAYNAVTLKSPDWA